MMTTNLRAVDDLISQLCCSGAGESGALDMAIASHMQAGGGRLRAAICYDAGLRLGVNHSDVIRMAAICELLHNASLIQDDMLDRSTTRRGSPSVWLQYSDTVAVCAGDLMLSAAYSAVSGLSVPTFWNPVFALVHQRVCEVIRGQVTEQQAINYDLNAVAEYENRACGKSASLLSLALELPLLCSGHSELLPTTHHVVSDFAIAYQIADDLMDVDADSSEGLLNIVLVIEKMRVMGRSDARALAAQRGLTLLAQAVEGAKQLPSNCADLLIHHAHRLQTFLTEQCLTLAGRP